MQKLTDITVSNLKPRAAQYEKSDAGARGLRVVVHPTGRKSFIVRFRTATGKQRKLTLTPGITLAAARKLAADAMLEVAQGRDPAITKRKTKQAATDRAGDTIERWAKAFIERHAKKHTRVNSWRQTVHVFDKIVLPAWKGCLVHDIERRDIRELLEGVAEDRPIMANRAHAVLSRFFGWLGEHEIIAASPMVGIKLPAKESPRERTLDDDEIRRLWLAAKALGGPEGACIKVLLLTGQRRGEIALLKWSEVADGMLSLSAERMKGKQSHVVPLSTQATAIIDSMPRHGDYVFGRSLIGQFDRVKRALDEHMGEMPKWVIHDIRRSTASHMARIGVLVPVIERILAHKSGTFGGVVGVYQKYSFEREMGAALQRWADHVEQLVTGKPAKILKLR